MKVLESNAPVTRFREVSELIDGRTVGAWMEVPWNATRTVADLAPEGCNRAVVNSALVVVGDPEWTMPFPPRAVVHYHKCEGDPIITPIVVGFVGSAMMASAATVGAIGVAGTFAAFGAIMYAAGLTIMVGAGLYGAYQMMKMLTAKPGDPGARTGATYGFSDVMAATANGRPIPVLYGAHPVGGVIVQHYTEEGEGSSLRYVVQSVLSHGPIHGIGHASMGTANLYTSAQDNLTGEDVPGGTRVNGNMILDDQVPGMKVSLRTGTDDQTPTEMSIIRQYSHNFTLKRGGRKFRYRTRGPVCDRLAFDLTFPAGLYGVSSKGRQHHETVNMNFKVYETDGTTEQLSSNFNIEKKIASPVFATMDVSGFAVGNCVLEVDKLSRDKPYKKRPGSQNGVQVTSVKEIQDIALSFPGLAVFRAEVQASEYLSGGIPAIIPFGYGRLCQTSDGTSWSGTETYTNNPAWIAADLLTSKEYGLGNHVSRDDLPPADWYDFAEWCDELVPLFTGSGDTEKRATFNGVFDEQEPAWDAAIRVVAIGRAALVKDGNTIRPVPFRSDRSMSQIINASVVKDPTITTVARASRRNVIELAFRNEDRNYEVDVASARLPMLDEQADSVRILQDSIFGTTSPHQANRAAHQGLRGETMIRRVLSFTAPPVIAQMQVGDVFGYVDEELEIGTAGARLAGYDGDDGNKLLLDREFTFAADTLYTYYEQSLVDDVIESRDFSYSTETTTNKLGFVPLHGVVEDDAVGRLYAIVRKDEIDLWRVVVRGTAGNGLARKIVAVEHVPAVFSDEAPEMDSTITSPSWPSITSASALTVVETSTRDGFSTLTASFTPGNGDLSRIWYAIGAASPSRAGLTDLSTFAFELEVDQGAPVTVWVQTLLASGGQDEQVDWPSAELVIAREQDGTDIIDIPGPVQNLTTSGVSGNTATLEWDEPADGAVDGYEVRFGEWNGGHVLYAGTATSLALVVPACGARYHVRAKRDGYYSPSGHLDVAGLEHASYPTNTLDEDIELQAGGTVSNMVGVPNWHRFEGPLLQVVPTVGVSYVSESLDAGSSAATHVGVDVRVSSFYLEETSEGWSTQEHIGPYGELAVEYLDWAMWVEHSTDGVTWTSVAWEDYANADLVVTGRYFRIRFEGSARATETEEESFERPALVMLERLNVALRRVP